MLPSATYVPKHPRMIRSLFSEGCTWRSTRYVMAACNWVPRDGARELVVNAATPTCATNKASCYDDTSDRGAACGGAQIGLQSKSAVWEEKSPSSQSCQPQHRSKRRRHVTFADGVALSDGESRQRLHKRNRELNQQYDETAGDSGASASTIENPDCATISLQRITRSATRS